MTYAYARVSTKDQNLNRQLDSFEGYDIPQENIYSDKKSGKDFERRNYIRLIKRLKRGDLLVIKSIDRLGRNYDMIIAEWTRIVNTIGADIMVIDMPLLDTRTTPESLVGKFISDIVLQVLSFVAENERANIRQRQKEGIAAAKLRGVKFGRPKKILSLSIISALKNYIARKITLPAALAQTKMKKSTFFYHLKNLRTAT